MRRMLGVWMMIGAFVLAGCQGGETETLPPPTPTTPLVAGSDGRTLEDLIEDATRPLDFDSTPALSELFTPYAEITEEPQPGTLFDHVIVSRQGGRGQTDYLIEIFADGRLIVNGVVGRLPEAEIERLQAILDESTIFSIPSNSQLWASNPDVFRYRFSVQMGQYEILLDGESPYIPQAVREIILHVLDYSAYVQ